MTMHPDPWPPNHTRRVGLHISQATPHHRDPLRPVFDDERRETRGGMIVAALAGWSIIALVVAVILVLA